MRFVGVLIAVLSLGACRVDCNVPPPGGGSPGLRVARDPRPGSPKPPSALAPPPAPPALEPRPLPAPATPRRSMERTRPALAPEGPPRDLPGLPEVFARWQPERVLPALQGAWLMPGSFLGSWEAWEVVGDRVRVYDGQTIEERTLALESPCTLTTTRQTATGFRGSTSVFTLHGSDPWKGLGTAGYRRGTEALVCSGARIFAFDGARCVAYRPPFASRPWQASETRCGFDLAEDGSEVFFYQDGDSEFPLYVVDDVLVDWQLRSTHSTRQPSFEAAMASRDSRRR